MNSRNPTEDRTFPMIFLWLLYCQSYSVSRLSGPGLYSKSSCDLFSNNTKNTFFISWIASLTPWFHRMFFFRYPPPISATFFHSIQQLNQWSLIGTVIIPFRWIHLEVAWTLLPYWMQIASSLLCPPMPTIYSYKLQVTYDISFPATGM